MIAGCQAATVSGDPCRRRPLDPRNPRLCGLHENARRRDERGLRGYRSAWRGYAPMPAESSGLDDVCSPYYEKGWKAGALSGLDVERLASAIANVRNTINRNVAFARDVAAEYARLGEAER